MAFSASFIAGGLATYWIMNHAKTGFALDAAATTFIVLAGIIFIVATITYLMSRRTKETSTQAIERQLLHQHQHKDAA